ncbi:MAG: hydantoinase B/oxoprolinase family protein, partial [Sciscionella sp.]
LTYPWGVNGGKPGARGTKWIDRADGTRQVLPSKCHDVAVAAGDVLHFVTWGGGGWGDPLERDPELVALEVTRGLVTTEGARRYGVLLGDAGDVDVAGTTRLRDRLRQSRPATLPVFDRGPPIPELLARCETETGLPAPRPPTWPTT